MYKYFQDLSITYENLQRTSVDQTDVAVKQLLATSNEAASPCSKSRIGHFGDKNKIFDWRSKGGP